MCVCVINIRTHHIFAIASKDVDIIHLVPEG